MSDVSRTILATRMLTNKLPDGDIAAEMLLSADIQTPVKMGTPPNPARCQQIIRGSFVKAATLAMSTDDPVTLEKLAKHASLGVKLAVVKNPAATDAARRIVEVAALKRGDNEMLEGVLEGARIGYLLEALADENRSGRVIDLALRSGALLNLLTDSESEVSDETLVQILSNNPGRFAEVIGRAHGYRWPCDLDPMELGALCSGDPAHEAKFLASFIATTPVFDDKAAEVLRRVAQLRPDLVGPQNREMRARFAASSMTPQGKLCLMSTSLGTARIAYAIEQKAEILNEIIDRYGFDSALAVATTTEISEENRAGIAGWVLEHLPLVGNGQERVLLEANIAKIALAYAETDECILEILQKTAGSLLHDILVGQNPAMGLERNKLIARTYPSATFKNLRYIKDPVEREALFTEAFSNAMIGDILNNFHTLGDHLSDDVILELIQKVAKELESDNPDRYFASHVRYFNDTLARESFVGYINNQAIDSHTFLWWLKLAKKRRLTLEYLGGMMSRKVSNEELEEILRNPGDMFESSMAQALARMFHEFHALLPVDILDRLVDAGGPVVVEQLKGSNGKSFSEYLTDRFARNQLNHDEWMTAFELLPKSPTSVGAAISAAKRLVRAKRLK